MRRTRSWIGMVAVVALATVTPVVLHATAEATTAKATVDLTDRRDDLSERVPGRPQLLTKEAHSDTSRVATEQRVFLKAGNLDLDPPLTWQTYGDTYTISS